MKLRLSSRAVFQDGFSLVEILMYIAVLAVVLGATTRLFFQTWDDSNALRRDAGDIVRVLHAGDEWRADVRGAAVSIQLTGTGGVEQLRIQTATNEIIYRCSNGELRRRLGANAEHLLLANVKTSRMQSESRHDIAAWRWELELKTVKKGTPWKPLFTFESVGK